MREWGRGGGEFLFAVGVSCAVGQNAEDEEVSVPAVVGGDEVPGVGGGGGEEVREEGACGVPRGIGCVAFAGQAAQLFGAAEV